MFELGVRRDKAALSSGRKTYRAGLRGSIFKRTPLVVGTLSTLRDRHAAGLALKDVDVFLKSTPDRADMNHRSAARRAED
jgi:hypothetical protein